jgi:dTMP kinase
MLRFREDQYPGKLITFCGLDGCGKTTLINMLDEYLKKSGVTAILTKQPTDAIRNSEMFRTYMDKEDHSGYDYRALSLSAAADRIQHTNKFIVPQLERGEVVISDRYFYSCLANHRARGYNDPWIYQVSEYIQKPDHAFFVDIDVETAMKRVRERASEKEKYIDVDLQYRLRDQYLQIAKDCGGTVISSSDSSEVCFGKIVKKIN